VCSLVLHTQSNTVPSDRSHLLSNNTSQFTTYISHIK
jgi:hypothetical protein